MTRLAVFFAAVSFLVAAPADADPARSQIYYQGARLQKPWKPKTMSWGKFIRRGAGAKLALAGPVLTSPKRLALFRANLKVHRPFRARSFNDFASRITAARASTIRGLLDSPAAFRLSQRQQARLGSALKFWESIMIQLQSNE
jgi:hypothetical protein